MGIDIKAQIRKITNKANSIEIISVKFLRKRKNTIGRTKIKRNFILRHPNLSMHLKLKIKCFQNKEKHIKLKMRKNLF